MPPTRQQSRARILRWERVVTFDGSEKQDSEFFLPRICCHVMLHQNDLAGDSWKLPRPRPPELRIERWMKFGHNLPGDFNMLDFYNPWDDADLGTRPREMSLPFTTPFNRDRADPRGV